MLTHNEPDPRSGACHHSLYETITGKPFMQPVNTLTEICCRSDTDTNQRSGTSVNLIQLHWSDNKQ